MVTQTSKGDGKVIKVDVNAIKANGETLTGAADALNDDGRRQRAVRRHWRGNEEALKDNEEALRGKEEALKVTGYAKRWRGGMTGLLNSVRGWRGSI